MNYYDEYQRWCELVQDEKLNNELAQMAGNEAAIEEAFSSSLSFGTGGIRSVMGVGTSRMNLYTVGAAAQGLADYLTANHAPEDCLVVIARDSRNGSETFAKTAAEVLAAAGISVAYFADITPTPCLAFAVCELGCTAGIMITASHNPSEYNGFKVYSEDGAQVSGAKADGITAAINAVDVFTDVRRMDFEKSLESGLIKYADEAVIEKFKDTVIDYSVAYGDEINHNISIVYSPLNGAGMKPVSDVLGRCGFNNVTLVREQVEADGNFPTCPYPNPEVMEAMLLGIEYAKRAEADIFVASDPDSDRIGVVIKDAESGEYRLLSGNEIGILMFEYICSQRMKHGEMPVKPLLATSIVTNTLVDRIAEKYVVEVARVLTGFKYIGLKVKTAKDEGKNPIFAFEESNGFLPGDYLQEKDAVGATMLACEMCGYYKAQGISLAEKLNRIYEEYGYNISVSKTYKFEGLAGARKIAEIMDTLRFDVDQIAGFRVAELVDYGPGLSDLPKSNVVVMHLENGSTVMARPSGTEPKIKFYMSIIAPDMDAAQKLGDEIVEDIEKLL